jgi:hypothetical protein
MRTIRIRSWHVALVLLLVTGLVATALVAASAEASKRPVNAGVPLSAPLQEPIPAHDGYQGWGQVRSAFGNGDVGRLRAPAPVAAWQWYDNYGWYQRGRSPGTQVYIWPYAAGWSWTWTERTGWYAMRTSDLTIGYRPIAIAT